MFKCDNCHTELEPNAKFCTTCGEKVSLEKINEVKIQKLEGLGGWLIFVGILIILSLMMNIGEIISVIKLYSIVEPLNKNSLNLLFVIDTAILGLSSYIVYLFFKKKKFFPNYFILFLILSLVYLPISFGLIGQIFPNLTSDDLGYTTADGLKDILGSILRCIIWIPYILISKRVKVTFVN